MAKVKALPVNKTEDTVSFGMRIPQWQKDRLKSRGRKNNRTMTGEAKHIFDQVLGPEPT